MHRQQHRVHRPLPYHADGIGHRIPVDHREAPVPGGIYPETLAGKEHRGDGGGGEIGGGGHGVLRTMVQEDEPETSTRVQPETP
jgi:hypothetical protein